MPPQLEEIMPRPFRERDDPRADAAPRSAPEDVEQGFVSSCPLAALLAAFAAPHSVRRPRNNGHRQNVIELTGQP